MSLSLVGIPSIGRSSRKPVAELSSAFVYVIDGHGNRQPWPPSGLQSSGMPLVLPSPPPPHAASTMTGTNKRSFMSLPRRRLSPLVSVPDEQSSVPQLTASRSLLRFAPFPFKHLAGVVFAPLFDRFLYRHPFEGGSARRYATEERPAFGDLDDRLLDGIDLASAKRLLDLGCGPATFAERAAARHPGLTVIARDPSRAFVRDLVARRPKLSVVQAAGEALPFADRSIDVAMMLSSIRHVRDRAATFRELRRVVRGTVVIVELDPVADARRVATHAESARFAHPPPRLRAVRAADRSTRRGDRVDRRAPPGSYNDRCAPIRSSRSTSWSSYERARRARSLDVVDAAHPALHGELSAIAEVALGDPKWWLVAGGVAVTEPWPARSSYVISDAEPGADTFIGFRVDAADCVGDAIARAHADPRRAPRARRQAPRTAARRDRQARCDRCVRRAEHPRYRRVRDR